MSTVSPPFRSCTTNTVKRSTGKLYKQLNQGLRDRIATLRRVGSHSNRGIGTVLGIHHATVGSELKQKTGMAAAARMAVLRQTSMVHKMPPLPDL